MGWLVTVQERGWDWGPGMHPMWWIGGAWGLGMLGVMLLFFGPLVPALLTLSLHDALPISPA